MASHARTSSFAFASQHSSRRPSRRPTLPWPQLPLPLPRPRPIATRRVAPPPPPPPQTRPRSALRRSAACAAPKRVRFPDHDPVEANRALARAARAEFASYFAGALSLARWEARRLPALWGAYARLKADVFRAPNADAVLADALCRLALAHFVGATRVRTRTQ